MMSKKGISAAEFHDFMSLVEQRDEFTDDEVKLILKTVGFLNKEVSREEKVRWSEYLTRRFVSLGIPLDVTYYNQVLRNYLQTNHRFSPVEFMTSMEKQGVAPNAVTLSRLVIAYCKVGDIKSASQILEHMRSSEMAINAKVYNSLILGNFIAGDKETAMQLFRDTSEMGFTADSSMYHAVAVGHALMGDLDGVKEVIQEAKDNFVMFSDGAFSTMIEQVAPKGRKDIIDYLLKELTETTTFYYNEASDTMPVLMEQGNDELAYQYFRGLNDPSARLFYRAALLTNMAPEDVVKYSRMLKKDGVRDGTLTEYFSLAVMKFFYESAIAILPHIEAEGETIRPQFIWPIIQYHKVMGDLEGLKKVIPFIDPYNEGRTIGVYLEPAVKSLGVSMEQYKSILQECSKFTEGQINACMVHSHLQHGGWKAAAEYAKSCKVVEDIPSDMSYLISGRLIGNISKSNWQHVLEVMASLKNCTAQDLVIRNLLQTTVDKEEVKKVLLEKELRVNENFLPKGFISLFTDEELSKVIRKKLSFEEMKDMSYKELMELGDVYGNNFLYKICLLDKSFKAQKWNTFKRTLESTDIFRVHTMPLVVVQAAKFYLRKSGNLQMCLNLYDHLQSQFSSFVPLSDGVLEVGVELCKEGRFEDAVKFLGRYNYNDKQETRDGMFIDYKSFFNMESTPENFNTAKQLLDTLSSNGYLPRMRGCLLYYWNFVCSSGDVNTIIEAFELLKNKHHFIPNDYAIALGHFIMTNDKGSLQTAFDKFTDVVMEQKVLISLAAAFLENKQLEKARKVLATPGMRLMTDSFRSICQRWAITGQAELIDEFTKLVQNLPGNVNKVEMLSLNLQAMCNKPNPDVDACVRFFETKFDEEEVEADINTLKFFSQFLKNHNREVPFDHFTMDLINEGNRKPQNAQASRSKSPPTQTKKQEEKKTETRNEKQVKKTEQNTSAGGSDFNTHLVQREFKSALFSCKDLTMDEIKQMLPEDSALLTEWAAFLVRGNHVNLLECLPEEVLDQFVNEMLAKLEGPNPQMFIQHYKFLLGKQPDRLLACVPKLDIQNQTAVFGASLFSQDAARSKAIKEMIPHTERPKFVHEVVMKMRKSALALKKDKPEGREPYFNLIDYMEKEENKASAVTYTLSQLIYSKDDEGIGLLAEKVKASGSTFEKLANLLSEKGRQQFITNIGMVEESFKSKNKKVQWEPSTNWKIEIKPAEVAETKGESTEITTEKAVTDIATEVDDQREIAVSKENPVDIAVKQTEKSEIFTVKESTEDIVDIAKTVSVKSEPEMKDKATVISDDSSEPGSKSESTKEKS